MAHILMLHGHPVGYLPPTYASEILTSGGNTVEQAIEYETAATTSGTWKIQRIGDHIAECFLVVQKTRYVTNTYGNLYFSSGEEIIFPSLGQTQILNISAQRISQGLGGVVIFNDPSYLTLGKCTLNVFNGKQETLTDDIVDLRVTFYIP